MVVKGKWKVLAKLLSLSYFDILIYLTFFIDRRKGEHHYRNRINFYPFTIFKDTDWSKVNHLKSLFNFCVNFFGNIMAFIPLVPSVYFLYQKRISVSSSLLIILLTTLLIETLQYIYDLGVFDVDDILLNFLGGIIGFKINDKYTIR